MRRQLLALQMLLLVETRQFDEAEEALSRLQNHESLVTQVEDLQPVICPQEGHAGRVAGFGFGDAVRCVCHGGALHNRVIVLLYHKSVRVMFVFVVDLRGRRVDCGQSSGMGDTGVDLSAQT